MPVTRPRLKSHSLHSGFVGELTQLLREHLQANPEQAGGLSNDQISGLDLDGIIRGLTTCERCAHSLLDTDAKNEIGMHVRTSVNSLNQFWALIERKIQLSKHQCGAR